ncbi:MAG: hypothetical protein ACE5HS_12990 [bacterium]
MKKNLLVLAVVCIVCAPEVRAQGVNLALLAGNGFKDGYNLGFGGRAGAQIPLNGRSVYFGGRAVFHQGTDIFNNVFSQDLKTKVQYFGGELGIVLFSMGVKIVATGVVGSAEISSEVPQADKQRERKLFLSPGVILSVPVGGFVVSADVRYLNVSDFKALAAYVAVGVGL